jgi:signal transduction histidine kinase
LDALERIEQASHGAIRELGAILGVLRDPESSESPRVPNPGIENIGELVAGARESGLDVQLQLTGAQPKRLSDAVSLAVYRIVQESLTNARRHAPGAAVRVGLGFGISELSLTVENARTASSNGSAGPVGIGLVGMRERATAVGGCLDAGPTVSGFALRAKLPYQPAR